MCATGESDIVGVGLQLACPIGTGCSWHVRRPMCVSLRAERGCLSLRSAHGTLFCAQGRVPSWLCRAIAAWHIACAVFLQSASRLSAMAMGFFSVGRQAQAIVHRPTALLVGCWLRDPDGWTAVVRCELVSGAFCLSLPASCVQSACWVQSVYACVCGQQLMSVHACHVAAFPPQPGVPAFRKALLWSGFAPQRPCRMPPHAFGGVASLSCSPFGLESVSAGCGLLGATMGFGARAPLLCHVSLLCCPVCCLVAFLLMLSLRLSAPRADSLHSVALSCASNACSLLRP